MLMKHPIPIDTVLTVVIPTTRKPIRLCWDTSIGINWDGVGMPATRQQLQDAITRCSGHQLPVANILPPLAPGDVVALADGVYWIDRRWQVMVLAGSELKLDHQPEP